MLLKAYIITGIHLWSSGKGEGCFLRSKVNISQVLEDWLDGTLKKERALRVVEEALQSDHRSAQLKLEATKLQEEAQSSLKEIPSWASEDRKKSLWKKQYFWIQRFEGNAFFV